MPTDDDRDDDDDDDEELPTMLERVFMMRMIPKSRSLRMTLRRKVTEICFHETTNNNRLVQVHNDC
jgi:hypothetical protein